METVVAEALDTGEEVAGEVWGAQAASSMEAAVTRQKVRIT